MKLTPTDLPGITRPTTKVDADEKARIAEAINVTGAKMFDKAMDLDTQYSVEYIEAAELAALAALELPTWQHAKALKESLQQGQALGTASVGQPAALGGTSTAPQAQPDQTVQHLAEQYAELLKRLLDYAGFPIGNNDILQFSNDKLPEVADRLIHSDPGSFVPIAAKEAAEAAHATTKEELRLLKESVQRANGSEVEINGTKYVKLPTANTDGEVTLDGIAYIKKKKHDEITNGWVKTLRGHVVAIRDSYNTKKSSIPKVDFTMTTEDATAHGDAVDALADFAKVKKTDKE